ncbi:hypothetical protein AJ79_09488 [Helicocarpus griseus UAMH5409]|uniref:GIY-YIG domain-containing protein n=1 Tax=Helicocarpus griseus UAMH5409 TaxID=1447875 RepID=A0A2B7WJK3_9EURO|nr:hypothetical protein AJ79_09488 [Helicocarpus griseus UAMH5409]
MAPSIASIPMIHDSQESLKPIPAFYCCYLLRSTVRHASLYIGSTPDPARRLAQHNGDKIGGAKRTSREKLRPWEMVVIVSGFMSRAGALQFEWAWQNTQDSRHAHDSQKNEVEESGVRICPRTGKDIKHGAAKPRTSLTNILANLHLLLRSSYFSPWPLEVRFFSEDVYHVWQVWSQRVDGILGAEIKVIADLDSDAICDTKRNGLLGRAGGIKSLDVSYDDIKEYVEKSKFLFEDEESLNCGVCKERLNSHHDIAVVCSHYECRCACHITCLSSRFLKGRDSKLVPRGGTCPACGQKLEWSVLMKEVTLRLWGQEEIKRLFRRRRGPGARKGQSSNSVKDYTEDESDTSKSCTDAETVDLTSCDDEPWIGGHDVEELRSTIGYADDIGRNNRRSKTDPESEPCHSGQQKAKRQYSRPQRSTTNKSDWDDVEIIE